MAKDEATLEKEKLEKLEKLRQEQSQQTYQDKHRVDDKQGSAYLISQIEGADEGDQDQFYKKLLFTVPEHPKPKYLYYTTDLKQAEMLEQNPDEDNNFIFNELMKNEIIRSEFERIENNFGQEAFELNKIGLINFIKKGRQNITYAVQYFGVDEGQIGILTRKVPYDSSYRKIQNTLRLPKIIHDVKIAPPKKDIYEFVEVEYSEDDEVSIEVDASSDEDFVPVVSKPKNNFDIVQGSVAGTEYKNLRKDSKPIEDEQQISKPAIIQIQTEPAKKKKKIKEKRRVKKKKTIKRLKEKRVESPPLDADNISQSIYNMQSASDISQAQNDIEVKSQQFLHRAQIQPNIEPQQYHSLSETKTKGYAQSQPNIRVINSRQKNEQSTMVFQERSNEELQSLESVVDERTPYMINFRELFKKVELSNIQDSKLPQPEKYNQHLVHQYSLPKGLHALKRQQVLSEAEQFDQERYSKKNVQLHMVDKGLSKMNLGGQTYGLKGSKVKPLYFQVNASSSQQSGYLQQNQKNMLNRNQSMSQTSTIDMHNLHRPVLNAKYNSKKYNMSSENTTVNNYLIGNRIQASDESQLKSVEQGKTSQRTHKQVDSVQFNILGQQQTQRSQPVNINSNPDETEFKGSDISLNNINQSDHSMQHQTYQMYNIGKANTEPLNINVSNAQHETSSMIHSKNFTLNQGTLPFDKVQNQSQSIQINQSLSKQLSHATKKNNLIIKNLARNKKIVDQVQEDEIETNYQDKPVGIFDKYMPNQKPNLMKTMQRNASDGQLLKQQGFQISNTMKISYLMDTKRLVNDKFKKRGNNKMGYGTRDDSDSEEDNIIFNQQSKTLTLKQPLRIKESIQLPSIRSTQLSHNHPDTTGSQQDHQFSSTQPLNFDSQRSHRDHLSVNSAVGLNKSNVKIVCRIRAPKQFESNRSTNQNAAGNLSTRNQANSLNQSMQQKTYTSVRHRASRSNSKDNQSPFSIIFMFQCLHLGHQASVRQTSRESQRLQITNSKSNSKGRNNSFVKGSKVNFMNNSGFIDKEKNYCIFTTKERSGVIATTENPVQGRFINEQVNDQEELKYFMNQMIGNSQIESFQFDQVFNESFKQDKFYHSVVSPAIRGFIEGTSASILLFGPTEGGKTYTLKGKTGAERGVLPRAVEDIFNIVKNSEQRQEDLEAINQRMMNSDEDDDGNFDSQTQRNYQSYNHNIRQSMDANSNVPERLFLKIQVYQIFVDKVLDLLNNSRQALTTQSVRVNQYIDRETKEVVSKLANVTEKAIFSLEDFYSVLQEAFKNRRLESVSMQESDLRKKSHFIIGLTLMKRNPQKQLVELAQLNFVELSGSEQAVAEDSYYKDQSIRQFVTRSFNGLSSQILRSALRKRSHNQEEGDAKLVNSIRNSLTQNSNIILICNVNPSPLAFHHSLPAIKFCARIRECIIKKQKQSIRQSYQEAQLSNQSIDSIPDQRKIQNDYQSIDKIQVLIDQIRDELYLKRQRPQDQNQQDKERWTFNIIDKVDSTMRMLYENSNQFDRQKSDCHIKELSFLKDQINQFRSLNSNQPMSPRNQGNFYQTQQVQFNNGQFTSQRDQYGYNPHRNKSFDQNCESDQRYMKSGQSSVERQMPYEQETLLSNQKLIQNKFIYTEDTQQDQGIYSDHEIQMINGERQCQTTRNQQNVVQGLRPHNLNKNNFQSSYQSLNNRQIFQRGLSNDQNQENEQIYANLNEIQVYQKQSENKGINSQSQSLNFESGVQSSVHSENDFLNKVNPYKNPINISQKQNSIQNHFSPRNEDKSISHIVNGQRPTSQNTSQYQKLQQQQQINQSPSNETFGSIKSQPAKNPLTVYLQNQSIHRSSLNNSIVSIPMSDQVSKKVSMLKQDTVYQSSQEAIQDISRLIKLNDFEGLKLRVKQIFKEKEEQDKIMDEQVEIMKNMRIELTSKEELIEEQDTLIRNAQVEFQATIDEFNQLKLQREINISHQNHEFAQHMKDLQQKVNELEQQKDQLQKAQDILEIENRELIKLKEESDLKHQTVKDENDKLRSNYDILKEHEMNIIRDYEGKKTKEINFFEQRLQDAVKQSQDDRQKVKELEEKIFQLKEEYQRMEFELQKSNEDRNHLTHQVQDLNEKIESDQEAVLEIKKQMESIEQDYQKLEEQKNQVEQDKKKAYNEINKLHMLVEEMDKNIQQEQQRVQDEIAAKKCKEDDLIQVCIVRDKLEQQIQEKDAFIQQSEENEQEYKRQLSQMASMNDELERQLTKIKAKEYDKVDLMKKGAEVEGRLKYYQVDNENLVRERNNLDIANVNLKKQNQELEQRFMQAQSELDYFKQAHEMHLDKFDQKFDTISSELQKLKSENIQLKEKEKTHKRDIREVLDEKEELQDRLKLAERRNDEMLIKLQEVERDTRLLMSEREKDLKESAVKLNFEGRFKEENKHRMLDDIQNMIKQYKYEKTAGKTSINPAGSGYNSNAHNYSTSSGYY